MMHVWTHAPWLIYGGQKTTIWSAFSSFPFIWVLGNKLRLSEFFRKQPFPIKLPHLLSNQ